MKQPKKDDWAYRLAVKIADLLFTGELFDEKEFTADRLALMVDDRQMCGWGFGPAVHQIAEVIRNDQGGLMNYKEIIHSQPAIQEALNTFTPEGIELAIQIAWNEGHHAGWVEKAMIEHAKMMGILDDVAKIKEDLTSVRIHTGDK